ncbi:unnamed protein product [Miscanthus lutarioriparius]|uniref:Uncharacterized protein n=1 Tax=Miscanthus lutarioriparius TaxID=422564 RepID=A0A811RI02_9POAL|nr:unnamed protein product [Miscanthus lutarioriparius]
MNRSIGKGRKRNSGCGSVPLGKAQGWEDGILLLQVKGLEQSGASWTPEGTPEQSTRGNRMGILIAASRMLTVIHGLSFAFFTAGSGSTEISVLPSSSAAEGKQ